VTIATPPSGVLANAASDRLADVRSKLVGSQLIRMGGAALTRLLDDEGLALLREEAVAGYANASVAYVDQPRDEDNRRGDPDRWLEWAPGGPALLAFYRAADTLELLRRLTGVEWAPSGTDGTYSYYVKAGHHLGLHRDIEVCDIAVITCLHDDAPEGIGLAGTLCLYPDRTRERLSSIRGSLERGASYTRLEPGQSLILLGGMVPHRLVAMAKEHRRIIAPLCYQVRP